MLALPFRQPRLVILTLLVILAAGLSSLLSLGRQEDPTITNIFATVTTPFPGAAPARVEALVTAKIEERLKTVPEIAEIESTSATGVSILAIELIETIPADAIEGVWTRIRDRLEDARAEFPEGALAPDFDSDNAGAYAALVALRAVRPGVPPTAMARHAEALADRLRAVPGTKIVDLFGLPQEEVLVEVDPARAAALGLTAGEIAGAIRAADAKLRAGRLRGAGADLVLEVTGEITALSRLSAVTLRQDGARATYLGDIARITRGPREPLSEAALAGGAPAVLIGLRIADGLQVDAWMGGVRAALAAAAPGLPAALSAEIVFDQSAYTLARLADLAANIAMGVAIVVGVLLVSLGWRAAGIVALVLPAVTLATLATLNFLKIPIHQMSVTGLIVALGLVVDAAIVMVDAVGRARAAGASALAAVEASVRRLAMPLFASTVTTALAFVPMILLPGPAGDFVGSIAIAVVVMLVWSFVIAVLVTPALAGWWLRPAPAGRARPGLAARAFQASLRAAARNPWRALMLSLVLPVAGFAAAPLLTPQFFPGVERDQMTIEVEMPEGTALAETLRTLQGIDALLASEPGIAARLWVAGRSAPAFYYNLVGNRDGAPGFAQALITTASPQATEALLPALQDRLSAAFPQARVLVKGLMQGPPVNAPVELRLVGPDIATLRELGDAARGIVAQVPGVTVVRTSLPGAAPKLMARVDEDAAQAAGLTLAQVAGQMEAATEGVTGGSMLEGTEELPVRVRLGAGLRADPARLIDLPLAPGGAAALAAAGEVAALPLSALARLDLVPADTAVTRRNGARVNTVQAFVAPGVLPEVALAEARAALEAAGFALPAGYRLEIGGDSDARASVMASLLAPLGLIVTLSLAVVVLTFDSFRLTFVTFLAGGLSAGLSFLALAAFGYPFGIMAVIGLIGSIGVSINAAIMILGGLQADAGAAQGDPAAVARVVSGQARHILSTTITTFGGFLPLILAGGAFWPPFAMSVAGGVLLSSVVSFWFAPAAFLLLRPRQAAPAPRPELQPVPQPLPAAAPPPRAIAAE